MSKGGPTKDESGRSATPARIPPMKKYPTPWQRKTMWAALTALFVVLLMFVVCSVVWIAANVIGFLQPILIPVAIAAILAYLLDPLVTRTDPARASDGPRRCLAIHAIVFLAIGGAARLARANHFRAKRKSRAKSCPIITKRARDSVVDLIFRYDRTFRHARCTEREVFDCDQSFVNWLLAGRRQRSQPRHAQRRPKPLRPAPQRVMKPSRLPRQKLTSADRAAHPGLGAKANSKSGTPAARS